MTATAPSRAVRPHRRARRPAVGNLLVVAALLFGLVYVRAQRKQVLS